MNLACVPFLFRCSLVFQVESDLKSYGRGTRVEKKRIKLLIRNLCTYSRTSFIENVKYLLSDLRFRSQTVKNADNTCITPQAPNYFEFGDNNLHVPLTLKNLKHNTRPENISSGWAGKMLDSYRNFEGPGSNLAWAIFFVSFSLCFSSSKLSDIIRTVRRDWTQKK